MALVAGIILVVITVLVHHEALHAMYVGLHRPPVLPRIRLVFGVLGALVAHIIEILLFTLGYWILIQTGKFGNLEGNQGGNIGDIIYFSFVTYASLGYGDITPAGSLRTVSALEVLSGMVMLAWTASFLFELIRGTWRFDSRRER